MTFFTPPNYQYDKTRIFRRLKIQPETTVQSYADSVFPRLENLAEENLELLICYAVIPNTLELDSPELAGCERLVVCYAGCSERIVESIASLMENGEYLEGYILNDLANEILFNASDAMNREIYSALKKEGLHLSSRFSPGENHLSMEHQKVFLELLQREEPLPIRLTEHYMLQPEKAMLYAFGAGANLPDRPVEHDCSICPNKDCFFRDC